MSRLNLDLQDRVAVRSTLARNTGWMLIANGSRVLFQAGYFVLIARALGSSGFGALAHGGPLTGWRVTTQGKVVHRSSLGRRATDEAGEVRAPAAGAGGGRGLA